MSWNVKRLEAAADIAACATMMAESPPWSLLYFSRDQCLEELLNPEVQVDGAMGENGELIGFLASMANGIGSEPMVEYLCIAPKSRGMRVGQGLMSYFEDVLFPDADNLYLFVSDINPDAARLYERLGYQMIGALPNFNLKAQTEFLHRKTRRPRQQRYSTRAT